MNKGNLFLHNHPMLEKSLGIDIKHVIIDRDAWNFVRAQKRSVDMPIYASIDAELKRAETKHPNYPNNMFEQLAIMNEEAGEVTKAVLHYHYESGTLKDISEELIQTAAMCVRMLKNPSIRKEKAILPPPPGTISYQDITGRLYVHKTLFGGAVILFKTDVFASKAEAQAFIDTIKKLNL